MTLGQHQDPPFGARLSSSLRQSLDSPPSFRTNVEFVLVVLASVPTLRVAHMGKFQLAPASKHTQSLHKVRGPLEQQSAKKTCECVCDRGDCGSRDVAAAAGHNKFLRQHT